MRMWEIREGYSPRESAYGNREGSEYERGFKEGYRKAMKESGMMGERYDDDDRYGERYGDRYGNRHDDDEMMGERMGMRRDRRGRYV